MVMVMMQGESNQASNRVDARASKGGACPLGTCPTCLLSYPPGTHTHTRARTHTHSRAHTHAHAHTSTPGTCPPRPPSCPPGTRALGPAAPAHQRPWPHRTAARACVRSCLYAVTRAHVHGSAGRADVCTAASTCCKHSEEGPRAHNAALDPCVALGQPHKAHSHTTNPPSTGNWATAQGTLTHIQPTPTQHTTQHPPTPLNHVRTRQRLQGWPCPCVPPRRTHKALIKYSHTHSHSTHKALPQHAHSAHKALTQYSKYTHKAAHLVAVVGNQLQQLVALRARVHLEVQLPREPRPPVPDVAPRQPRQVAVLIPAARTGRGRSPWELCSAAL